MFDLSGPGCSTAVRSDAAISSALAALLLAASACSFDSGLESSKCTEQQEGEGEDGRVCRDGYWVNVGQEQPDADVGTDVPSDDTGIPVDTGEIGDTRDVATPDVGPDSCIRSEEVCNGIDDDCDGRVDDGIDCSCNYNERDRGVCADARLDEAGTCQRPGTYNATEVRCDDGKDNDCDGSADGEDSDCKCSMGETRDCYTGPNDTEGVGICSAGQQTCANGQWGPCENEATPDSGEICGDGLDNDCDGTTDNGCECAYDPSEDDSIDTDGSNAAGVCADQSVDDTGACSKPGGYESRTDAESNCDDLDNDCDGAVDEGCDCTFDPFEPGRTDTDGDRDSGVCTGQSRNGDGLCRVPSTFETETDSEDHCNGTDNDCDGATDEGCPCDYQSSSEGVCGESTRDTQGNCTEPSAFDSADGEQSAGLCDDLDNDCDGATDEGCPCNYNDNPDGVCATASRDADGICAEPGGFDSTDDESSAGNCDQVDNDCDGATDEGCPCDFDGDSAGVCGSATISTSGVCQQPVTYEPDTDVESFCDGSDNDCDGVEDEGCPCNFSGTSEGVCGSVTFDTKGNCPKPGGYDSTDDESAAGACDQLDNDCDGYTDEGCSCDYNGTPTGVCGTAERDNTGTCQKPGNYESPELSCDDGVDNDCDGTTDEASKQGGASCSLDCECYSGDCDGGTCNHRVFVTADELAADFGGLTGADTRCNDLAASAGLEGTWKAVLSDTSTDAKDRISITGEVVRLDGRTVASNASEFWSDDHVRDIDRNENGNQITTCGAGCEDDHVWTGTTTDGTGQGEYCGDWNSKSAGNTAGTGDAGTSGPLWVEEKTESCDETHHLYCIDGQ